MKKIQALLIAINLIAVAHPSLACHDVFINHPRFHLDTRTVDLPINMSFNTMIGYIGQKNTTNIIADPLTVPASHFASWINKHGYVGRAFFNSPSLIDGMNTEGLSVSVLYAPGASYPKYNPEDRRPVLAIFDVANFLLSQAATVQEAIVYLHAYQLVQSAIQANDGYYIQDVSVQLVIRDKLGVSAGIIFQQGQMKIVENITDSVIKEPYVSDKTPPTHQLLATKLANARNLLAQLATPTSHGLALYQASIMLDALTIPTLPGVSATSWGVIKDLDHQVMYFKDIGRYQTGGVYLPSSLGNGYVIVDLKNINFKAIPLEYMSRTIQPTLPNTIKKILSAK